MPDYSFILNKFGIAQRVPYSLPTEQEGSKPTEFDQIKGYESNYMTTGRNQDKLTTYLGTPVFADIILSNQDENKSIQLTACVVEVNQAKIIERTTVRGRNGTVKEYWSMDDFEVRLRGAIIEQRTDYYPNEEVQNLHDLLKLPESLKVVSRFLQMFDIYELTVKDYYFPPIEGVTNVQYFDITCYSDEPEELILKNE
jgi:hypothetical protein